MSDYIDIQIYKPINERSIPVMKEKISESRTSSSEIGKERERGVR